MNYRVTISRDLNLNSLWIGGYTLTLTETEDAAAGSLQSESPVCNNRHVVSGVFGSRDRAITAVSSYLAPTNFQIERDDWGDYRLRPVDRKLIGQLIARKTANDLYIAH